MTQEKQSGSWPELLFCEANDDPSFSEIVEHFRDRMYIETVQLRSEDVDFAKISIKQDKTVAIEAACISGGFTKCEVFHPFLREGTCVRAYRRNNTAPETDDWEQISNTLVVVTKIFSGREPVTNKKFIAFSGNIGQYCIKEDGSIGQVPS